MTQVSNGGSLQKFEVLIMRKGQLELIEKAKKYQFTPEQIAWLEHAEGKIEEIRNMYRLFRYTTDFPVDVLEQYLKSNNEPWDLYWEPRISYLEYVNLPASIHQETHILHYLYWIQRDYFGSAISVLQTAQWAAQFCDGLTAEQQKDYFQLVWNVISDEIEAYKRRMHQTKNQRVKDTASNKNLDYIMALCKQWYLNITPDDIKRTKKALVEQAIKNKKDYIARQKKNHDLDKEKIADYNAYYDRRIKEAKTSTPTAHDIWKHCVIQTVPFSHLAKTIADISQAALSLNNPSQQTASLEPVLSLHKIFKQIGEQSVFEYISYPSAQAENDAIYIRDHLLTNVSLYANGYKVVCSVPNIQDNIQNLDKPIFISFFKCNKVWIVTQHTAGPASQGEQRVISGQYNENYATKILIYSDGTIYKSNSNNAKYRPIFVRELLTLVHDFHADFLLEAILQIEPIKNSYIFKDLVQDFDQAQMGRFNFPSFTWNDCIGIYSRNQLMATKFKHTYGINFNKLGICRGYAYLKALPYVDESSRNILYNAITTGKIQGYHGPAVGNRVASDVLTNFLLDKLTGYQSAAAETNVTDMFNNGNYEYLDSTEISTEVHDYVRNCLQSKKPVNLKFKSIRKVITRNTDITLENSNQSTPKIIIPRNSKFKDLRAILPEDFEWIRSRQRIIAEGQLMRHCVASYADSVNRDLCAIYHLFKNGKNYTIEFRYQNGQYYINQVQSRADRGAPQEVRDYIQGFLDEAQISSELPTA